MYRSALILVGIIAAASARPGFLSAPYALATLQAGAQVGPDGRVVDTPEVAVAKAEHAVAQVNERLNLANEAVRSGAGQLQAVLSQPALVSGAVLVRQGAPVGPDGRVVDTPEVAVAKVAHAAAQVNERIALANEAARSSVGIVGIQGETVLPVVANGILTSLASAAPVGPDGRVLDTPEVAAAKAAHAAAQVNERINLANEAARSQGAVLTVPVVANRVITSVVPGAPIGLDGRVQDTAEVAVAKAAHAAAHINEKINLANEAVKSAQVLAVAGPTLALGRLVY